MRFLMELDGGLSFFDRSNVSIFPCPDSLEFEEIIDRYTLDPSHLKKIFKTLPLDSAENLATRKWIILTPYQNQFLENEVESQPDFFRVIAGQMRFRQVALETYFVIKYTLIFTEKTLKNLSYKKATGDFFKNKTMDISVEGATGIKNLRKKKFFIWTDFLIVKPSAWNQEQWEIHDARKHHFHSRMVHNTPNLDLKLPPIFFIDQFDGLKEFLSQQTLYSKLKDQYENIESLFDNKVEPSKKKGHQVIVLLGHATEETARVFIHRQSKTM